MHVTVYQGSIASNKTIFQKFYVTNMANSVTRSSSKAQYINPISCVTYSHNLRKNLSVRLYFLKDKGSALEFCVQCSSDDQRTDCGWSMAVLSVKFILMHLHWLTRSRCFRINFARQCKCVTAENISVNQTHSCRSYCPGPGPSPPFTCSLRPDILAKCTPLYF